MNLLIVDDEEIILNGIKDAVSSSALPLKSVRTASSAKSALKMLMKDPCDIIVSDIRMPDMDGLENVISVLDYVLDTKRKRHIMGGILLSVSFLFGGLAITVMTIRNEEEEDEQ